MNPRTMKRRLLLFRENEGVLDPWDLRNEAFVCFVLCQSCCIRSELG